MRVRASGRIPSLDITLLTELAAAFHTEWQQLRFDAGGEVVDPSGGCQPDRLRLVDGRHGSIRARYLATIRTPLAEWAADGVVDGEAEAGAEVAEERVDLVEVVVTGMSRRSIAFSVGDATHGSWVAALSMDHSASLRAAVSARSTVLDLAHAYGAALNGCLSWLVRGPLTLDAQMDLGALERRRRGEALDLAGQASRYLFGVRVRTAAKAGATDVDVTVSLRGRGMGRVIVLVAWPFVRREIKQFIEQELADATRLADDVDSLRSDVARAGGPSAYAHATIWDPTFPASLDRSSTS